MGSSPDNDGTHQHCQMVRVRLARQRGVTKVNQWLNPLKCGTGSNLVDVGRAAACVSRTDGRSDSEAEGVCRWGGHGECLRRNRGKAAAAKLGVDPVDRCMVNVGTVSVLLYPASGLLVGGQVHRRLLMPERGGGSVVVRARESRVHGEGAQRVRREVAGMSGDRR